MTHIPPLQPFLEPPGAGLSPPMTLLLRHVLGPVYRRLKSTDGAVETFEENGARILALTRELSPEALDTRVLVAPMAGLEDSSRWWSVAETLEHLIVTGDEMAEIITCLARGELPLTERVTTARVKPRGAIRGVNAQSAFADFLQRFLERMSGRARTTLLELRWEHPWFGPLTAHGWMVLAGAHQGLHGRQVRTIIRGLRAHGRT